MGQDTAEGGWGNSSEGNFRSEQDKAEMEDEMAPYGSRAVREPGQADVAVSPEAIRFYEEEGK